MTRFCTALLQEYTFTPKWVAWLSVSLTFCLSSFGQKREISPPFQSGKWYKIGITETGIHTIDDAFLKKYGLPKNTLKSEKLALFGTSPHLLPQRIEPGEVPLTTWQEIPLKLQTIRRRKHALFFADSPHRISWDSLSQRFTHQLNPYTDTTYYYLQIGGQDTPKQIPSSVLVVPNTREKSSYIDYLFEEKEYQNLVRSGRNWVGDYVSTNFPNRATSLNLSNYVLGSPIQISSSVVGASMSNQAQLSLSIDDQPPFGIHTLLPIGNGRYDRKGNQTISTFTTESTHVNPMLRYVFQGTQGGAYIDYLGVQFERTLAFGEKQTIVRLPFESQAYRLPIQGRIPSNAFIWDVTNPFETKEINPEQVFHPGQTTKTFVLATDRQILKIPSCQPIHLQPIPATDREIQLVIISPTQWKDQAERLRQHRETEGIQGTVWDLETLYAHFSGGLPDPTAIRNLARWYWKKYPKTFKYLLLMGDATYDYKNHLNFPNLPPFIPTYQSRESYEPIYSYSSDDYFGFLEEQEGDWLEGSRINGNWFSVPQGNHTLEIGIGRLPITSWQDAKNTVDKLISYKEKNSTNDWQKRIIWVADDEDQGIHQQDAEQLSTYVSQEFPGLTHQKIYLDAFPQVQTAQGERAVLATQTFQRNIQDGAFILNYTGHGSEDILANEQLFTRNLITNWRNKTNAPIWITATCEFGRFDNPSLQSAAEQLLLSPTGGAVGLFTTTRPVFSNTNFTLNFSLLRALFSQKEAYIGDVFRIAKNNATAGVINRNFTLLGDPSIRLPLPTQSVTFDTKSEKGLIFEQGKATKISGKTAQQSTGKIQIEVRTSPNQRKTLGNNTPQLTYTEQGKVIFKAEWTVHEGMFEGFVSIPTLVNLGTEGELTALAIFPDGQNEEIGHLICQFEPERTRKEDKTPPKIEVQRLSKYQIHIRLSDESGIYLHSSKDSLAPMYTINGIERRVMSQNWRADSLGKTIEQTFILEEDISKIAFITFVVHDLHTNQARETFYLEDDVQKSDIRVHVFPNPIKQFVTFEIDWEADKMDADISLDFFDLTGKRIFQSVESCYICDHKFNWSLQNPIFEQLVGVYIYRVSIRNRLTNHFSATSGRIIFSK